MTAISPERAEAVFDDFKAPYSLQQAIAEAERCLYCYDAPCIKACPTTIDIPTFIRKIATGNVKGSAKTIFETRTGFVFDMSVSYDGKKLLFSFMDGIEDEASEQKDAFHIWEINADNPSNFSSGRKYSTSATERGVS